MRIGVTTNSLAKGGGMERQAYDIIEGLAKRGFRVTVFTRKFDPSLPLIGRLDKVAPVRHPYIPGKLRDKFFSRAVDRLRKKFRLDIVISCNRIENSEIVVCGGDHLGYLAGMGLSSGWTDRLHVKMEQRQFGGAKRIAVCSGMIRDELVALYGIPPERITVLYPAADLNRFRPASGEERQRLRKDFGFAPDRKYFLFPSGAHIRKGLPFLRSFFEKTDLPVALAVAGREAPAGRNIMVFGYAPSIEDLYRASDAVVMASRYEPFGMIGVEAALCGIPSILTQNMGCCEALTAPALLPIRQDGKTDLENAARTVLATPWQESVDFRDSVAYDPSPDAYVDALVKLF